MDSHIEWSVQWVPTTASTNADLMTAAAEGAAEGSVVATEHQTAGRGRLDRRWEAPAGSGIAVSVLLHPTALPAQRWGWISLLTGLAVAEGIASFGLRPRLKWPNDVELDGAKVAGILVEGVQTPTGMAAVVGFGVNTAMSADQLPVPTATSLHLNGVDIAPDELLSGILSALRHRYDQVTSDLGSLREDYRSACSTLGAEVCVALPGDVMVEGPASDVDTDGRLIVGGRPIAAGDVVNVRR